MANFRKELDEIIHTNGGDNWWKPELFEKYTHNILPKELEVLKTPPNAGENYNCFIYVLGFANDSDLIKDCGGFIYDTFFQKLIDQGLLEYTDTPSNGDYILYRDIKNNTNMITHIGVVENDDMVISKWAWGPLLKHKTFDVPESYGNDILYVRAISKEKAKMLYKKYREFNVKPKGLA